MVRPLFGKSAIAFILALGLATSGGAADGPDTLFNPIRLYGIGGVPQFIGAGNFTAMTLFTTAQPLDMDNDGDLDIVMVSDGAFGSNKIYQDLGSGFTFLSYLYTNVDVDTSGVIDVSPNVFAGGIYPNKSGGAPTKGFPPVGTNPYVGSDIGWLENDGFGNFTFHFVTINGGADPAWVYNPRDVRAGDIDGDGQADDFVVFNNDGGVEAAARPWGGCSVSWFRYEGGGNFSQHIVSSWPDPPAQGYNPTPRGGDLADMDADGDLDVLVADYGSGELYWFENDDDDSDGQVDIDKNDFKAIQVGGVPAFRPAALKILGEDFDGDGDTDVLVGRNSGAGANAQITFLKNSGDGINFTEFSVTGVNFKVQTLDVADFNGDGLKDVVAGFKPVALFLTDDASFTSWTRQDPPNGNNFDSRAIELQAKDMNQDGRPDVVASFSEWGPWDARYAGVAMDSNVHIWVNRLPNPWDEVGLIEADIPLLMDLAATAFDMGGLAIADFDGDGDRDVFRAHGVYPAIYFENRWNTQRGVRIRARQSRGKFEQTLTDILRVSPQKQLGGTVESTDR